MYQLEINQYVNNITDKAIYELPIHMKVLWYFHALKIRNIQSYNSPYDKHVEVRFELNWFNLLVYMLAFVYLIFVAISSTYQGLIKAYTELTKCLIIKI